MSSKLKKKLGNVMTFQRGKDLTHSQMNHGMFPVVGSSEIIGWHNEGFVEPPVVLVGRSGTVGRPQFFDKKIWAHNTTLYVKDFHGNDPKFCYYFLKSINLENYANFSGVPTLNRNFIHPLLVSIPDLPTQKLISNVLSKLDDKIEINSKSNFHLKQLIQRVYEYWFFQFDFTDKNGKPYKSSGGDMEYCSNLKRMIPSGWKVKTLYKNDIAKIISPGVDSFTNKNYLATANIIENSIYDGDWISYENRESRANMQPVYNSLWFAKMKNSIKHLTITEQDTWILEKYILSTGFLGLSAKPYAVGYLHCVINSEYFEKVKDRLSHGATQEAVNNNDMKFVKIVIPPKEILVEFNSIVLPMIKKMNLNLLENMKLSSIRDYLLPLLMNGQLEVKDKLMNERV